MLISDNTASKTAQRPSNSHSKHTESSPESSLASQTHVWWAEHFVNLLQFSILTRLRAQKQKFGFLCIRATKARKI